MTLPTVHIALGSNLGDRLGYLNHALQSLAKLPGTTVVAASSVYESPAMVLPDASPQPNYLNAVVALVTPLPPQELLAAALSIETAHGRTRTLDTRWEARTLDIDIIVWENQVIQSPDLTLPHPGLANRRFVLTPLAEIAPNLQIPDPFHQTVRYLLAQCQDTTSVVVTSHTLKLPPKA